MASLSFVRESLPQLRIITSPSSALSHFLLENPKLTTFPVQIRTLTTHLICIRLWIKRKEKCASKLHATRKFNSNQYIWKSVAVTIPAQGMTDTDGWSSSFESLKKWFLFLETQSLWLLTNCDHSCGVCNFWLVEHKVIAASQILQMVGNLIPKSTRRLVYKFDHRKETLSIKAIAACSTNVCLSFSNSSWSIKGDYTQQHVKYCHGHIRMTEKKDICQKFIVQPS